MANRSDKAQTGHGTERGTVFMVVGDPPARTTFEQAATTRKPIKDYALASHTRDYQAKGWPSDKHPVPPHVQAALWCPSRPHVWEVASWFGVPEARVSVWSAGSKRRDTFLEAADYLNHRKQVEEQGKRWKAIYSDEEIVASFDYRAELDALHERQDERSGEPLTLRQAKDALAAGEMSLREALRKRPALAEHKRSLQLCRLQGLCNAPKPRMRLNYYMQCANFATGRTAAQALAMAHAPELPEKEAYYLLTPERPDDLADYDGQPTVVWSSLTLSDAVERFGAATVLSILRCVPGEGDDDSPFVNKANIFIGEDYYQVFLAQVTRLLLNKDPSFYLHPDDERAYHSFRGGYADHPQLSSPVTTDAKREVPYMTFFTVDPMDFVLAVQEGFTVPGEPWERMQMICRLPERHARIAADMSLAADSRRRALAHAMEPLQDAAVAALPPAPKVLDNEEIEQLLIG